ncbi:MAG: S41 family peptidase, partial [Candidatus Paceibacteria bacterium]
EDEGEGAFVCATCKSRGPNSFREHKVVILVNEGSASASEILAGALRDNRGIKLIGTKTFGKGSVQELRDLRGGASVKITVAKWLTPNEIDISEEGLEPDILVENPVENEEDLQLKKAIEVVRQL